MTVAVIGAGPAGCAVAAALAANDVRVTLIDAGSKHSWPGESLPPGARQILSPIFGAAPLDNPAHRIAYSNRSAWGSPELSHTDFLFNPLGHGWHVDRGIFDSDLRAAALEHGARIECDQRLASCSRTGGHWQFTLADGRVIECRYVVDATGRAAWLARRQGVRRIALDRQVALIGVIEDSRSDDSTTLVESTPGGWWYTSPLPGSRRVVAFLTDADLLPEAPSREETWRQSLRGTRHIAAMIEGCALPAMLSGSPAETSHLEKFSGEGWLAVGDAAIAWDPLSSQGILTAILMGGRGAAAILAQLEGHGDDLLRNWEAEYRELLREHCEERRRFAEAEDRWPDEPFWKRRRTAE